MVHPVSSFINASAGAMISLFAADAGTGHIRPAAQGFRKQLVPSALHAVRTPVVSTQQTLSTRFYM